MNKAALHKVTDRIKKLRKEKMCLAPSADCEGQVIRAHTISENLMLRPISRDGHVFTWSYDFKPTQGVHDKISFRECGVSQTSVFYGFCEKHDRLLFSSFETEQFVCSRKQLAMLYFRAIAREYYVKIKQLESIVSTDEFKEVHGIPSEIELDPNPDRFLCELSSNIAVAEIHELKEKIDGIINTEDYVRIISRVFEIEGGFPVVCSGLTNPDFDFDGNLVQDISDITQRLDVLSFSIVPQGKRSFAIFSYLDIHAISAEHLIRSLLPRPDIAADLIWMTFCHFENSAYAPEWVDGLSKEVRDEFQRAAFSNVNLFDPDFGILADRKIAIPGFKVIQTFEI